MLVLGVSLGTESMGLVLGDPLMLFLSLLPPRADAELTKGSKRTTSRARGSEAASAPPLVEEREREEKSIGCPMTPSPILPTCRSEWSGETSSSRSGETRSESHIANECDEGDSHCDDARLIMSKNMTQFREPVSPMPPNEFARA